MSAATTTFQSCRKPATSPPSLSVGGLLQRKCACGSPAASLAGQCEECKSKGRMQSKLTIGASDDPLEQEADRIADQVLAAGADPAVGHMPPRILRYAVPATQGMDAAPASVDRILASSGKPLEPALKKDMEQSFGHDFSRVRVHTGTEAERSARDINAHAYTVGHNIVFASGQFAPDTCNGRWLITHELAHVVQQSGSDHARVSQSNGKFGLSGISRSIGSLPLVQRQPNSLAPATRVDERANDPNFLLCLALCDLGIPPSLWRTVVNEILRAVSQEYRDRLGDIRGSQEFERWRAEFTVMITFNKFKLLVGFLGESRIGLLTVEHPAAQAIRRAVLARLAERGLETATLEVASQIIRKVALAIEAAILVGCAGYCGATGMINALLDFSSAALEAITKFINLMSQIGTGLSQAITRPILVAYASMSPINWNLSLPGRSRQHMNFIGAAFRLAVTPDSFLESMGRTLNSYNISPLLVELAQDINATLQARGGFAQLVTFTADFIGGLTPLQFIDILKDYRLLSFVEDPQVLADRWQAQPTATLAGE